jgi:hypothetical protein
MSQSDPFRHCPKCASRGLIRVQYRSGEVFDVAICDCPAGQFWRHEGADRTRRRLRLPRVHQIALVETFEGESGPQMDPIDFVAAGKTAKRAKL